MMNLSNVIKDGNVHDLGSDKFNRTTSNVVIRGKGSRDGLMEYAHSKMVGMDILSESIREDGDVLIYEAEVSSGGGIPFSHHSGKVGMDLILPEVKPVVNFSFGDVDLKPVNCMAFGDI